MIYSSYKAFAPFFFLLAIPHKQKVKKQVGGAYVIQARAGCL